jgi:hypothetical protein
VLRSFVHLAPMASVTEGDAGYEVAIGEAAVTIMFDAAAEDELSLADAWVSDRYGVRERAPVLVLTARRRCSTRLTYRIAPATPPG